MQTSSIIFKKIDRVSRGMHVKKVLPIYVTSEHTLNFDK